MNERKSFRNAYDSVLQISNSSGLYFCYDKDDNLLYIGKAKLLKNRIKEHRENNLLDREGRFYLKIQESKGYTSRNEWPKVLDDAFRDFESRYLFHLQSPLVIDRIFHRVNRIEIEEMPHELTKEREKNLIKDLKPPFNSQTTSDEYYQIQAGDF